MEGVAHGAVPRIEKDVNLFRLLLAYNVSANRKIGADQVKVLHAAAKRRFSCPFAGLQAQLEPSAESSLTPQLIHRGIFC